MDSRRSDRHHSHHHHDLCHRRDHEVSSSFLHSRLYSQHGSYYYHCCRDYYERLRAPHKRVYHRDSLLIMYVSVRFLSSPLWQTSESHSAETCARSTRERELTVASVAAIMQLDHSSRCIRTSESAVGGRIRHSRSQVTPVPQPSEWPAVTSFGDAASDRNGAAHRRVTKDRFFFD